MTIALIALNSVLAIAIVGVAAAIEVCRFKIRKTVQNNSRILEKIARYELAMEYQSPGAYVNQQKMPEAGKQTRY